MPLDWTVCLMQAEVKNTTAQQGLGKGTFTVHLEGPANLWGKLLRGTAPILKCGLLNDVVLIERWAPSLS